MKKKERRPTTIPLIGFMSVPPREMIEPETLYDEIDVARVLNTTVRPCDLMAEPA